MKKFFPFLMVLLILFSSCTSFDSIVELGNDGLPSWVRNPRVRSGRIVYISEGSGESREAARSNAMENALIEIGRDLGIDAYSLYFRELGTTGKISELDGSLNDEYVREYRGGRFSCYILLDISEQRFLEMRSPELTAIIGRENEIRNLLEKARNSYMENMDIEALSQGLKALSLSLDMDLNDPSLSADSILETVMYYLEPLEIRVHQEGEKMEAEISVRRNRGLLSPLVYSAPLLGKYSIRDTNGDIVDEEISFNTGSGRYDFVNRNPYVLSSGTMSLALDLDMDMIREIESKAESGYLSDFLNVLQSKNVTYEYRQEFDLLSVPFAILIAEYDLAGNLLDDTSALDTFNTTLQDSNRPLSAENGYGDDDEQIISSYYGSGGNERYLFVMRLGVADSVEDEGRFIVNVRTSVDIYDSSTESMIASDDSVSSIGYGSTYEEACADAFRSAGRILADVILIEL